MKLRIGHLSTFYHTSILMMARGAMAAEVEWKLFGTGPAIVNAFEKGEIDLGYIGLPPAIIGIDRGVPIKCVAGGHVEGTVISGNSWLRGFPEIEGLDDILKQFIGQKIGVPGKGSIHDVILAECLESYELNKNIEVVNFKWADLVLEAFYKGEISAAVGTPALAAAISAYANGRLLYPAYKLWPNNPSYGILVNTGLLEKERGLVERFLLMHEDATSFLRNQTDEAARIISSYAGVVDRDFVLETLRISPRYCASITDEYINSTREFIKVLKKLGYIKREIAVNEIFDTSLIRKIHPLKDHYRDIISAA